MNSTKGYLRYVVAILIFTSATNAGAGTSDTIRAGSDGSLDVIPMSLLRSSYRDQYQRNLQQLKLSHQETIRKVINTIQIQSLSESENGNELQRQMQSATITPSSATMAPTDFSFCNSDGTLNFDDDFNANAYDSRNIFDTMCTCVEESNFDQISIQVLNLNTSDIPTYVSMYNKLIGETSTIFNYRCSNNCESCFVFGTETNRTCGLLTFESLTSEQFLEGNFTFEELQVLTTATAIELLDDSRYYTNQCIDYKTAPYTGKLCLTVEYKGLPDENSTIYCNITYGNTLCNSCVIPPGVSEECALADCTNIDPNAMINICENTGLVGPFQYFGFLSDSGDSVDNTTFTLGTCSDDGGSVSIETPVSSPVALTVAPTVALTVAPTVAITVALPVPAITTNAPIDQNVTSPSTSPSTSSPTDVNSTNITTMTNAPVPSPVRAPSPTANVTTPINTLSTSDGDRHFLSKTSIIFTLLMMYVSI